MEIEQPSKLQISVSSIKEFNLTEGEIKLAKKQSEIQRKKSNGNQVALKKSRDEQLPIRESKTSPGRDIKRTVSLSASKKTKKRSSIAIQDNISLEPAEKRVSNASLPAAKKRSSSAEQHTKTKSHTTVKDPKSKTNLSPEPAEKRVSNASLPAAKKRSSSTQRHQQIKSHTTIKDLKSKPSPDKETDGNTNAPPDATSKPSQPKVSSSRKPSSASSPPGRRRQGREPIGASGPSPPTVPGFPAAFPPARRARSRTGTISGPVPPWANYPPQTPTPWSGLGTDGVAVVATASGSDMSTRRRRSVSAGTPRGSVAAARDSSDHGRPSSTGDELQRCLSLSVARAVTDEHKRSFLFAIDDQMLAKLKERADELKREQSQTSAWSSPVTAGGSQVELRPDGAAASSEQVRRTSSGSRRVSSGSNAMARGKRKGSEKAKGMVSIREDLNRGSTVPKDVESKLASLESKLKTDKKGRDKTGSVGGKVERKTKDTDVTAALDEYLTSNKAKDNTSTAAKDTKRSAGKNEGKLNSNEVTKAKKDGPTKPAEDKKPATIKDKVLQTLNEKRINLIIPQTLKDPREFSRADQEPLVIVTPSDRIPDSEAGRSQGPDASHIPEEFFTSPAMYRTSIELARQRMSHSSQQSSRPPSERATTVATSTETAAAEAEEVEEAPLELPPASKRSGWYSSSDECVVGSDGNITRRRKSTLRRLRASSAQAYQHWKRKKSARAYSEYQRRTDPRYYGDDDKSSKSTTLSLYPATSSEDLSIKTSCSDVSSVPADADADLTDGMHKEGGASVTVATSTTDVGRTEGTQTSSTEYLLLDRQSCLVKVLAALQRLNTDEALQVARILRRSLEEGRGTRVYEDTNVKQVLDAKRSQIDAMGPPAIRTESEKVMAQGGPSRTAVMQDNIPDQDYDELTRIVSQIDLMVRSKLRITAAPYSIIYETLINYHLEITQDYSPSVAVFNYYLTEQGHPLFDDTSGFFRPTILQVARESLYPRLYAHPPLGETRELPAGARLLDLQLLLDELLICPFCGHDVIWGQDAMCVEFCCEAFAEVVSHEYEDDLGRIRRQAALRQRCVELGELEEDEALLSAALSAASCELQPPAKISCRVEKRARLKSLKRYGQDGAATGSPLKLPPFTIDVDRKASAPKTAAERKAARRKSHEERRKSDGDHRKSSDPRPSREERRKASAARHRSSRRHSSGPRKKARGGRRRSTADGAAAGDDDETTPPVGKRRHRDRKRLTKRNVGAEVGKIEKKLGRKLTEEELDGVMDDGAWMHSNARGLSITVAGISEKRDVSSMDNFTNRALTKGSPKASRLDMVGEYMLNDEISTKSEPTEGGSLDADDEAADGESTATSRRRGKGRASGASRRNRRKTRAVRDRDPEESSVGLETREGSKRGERSDRESLSDDQLRYRLSEGSFLEEGVTQLPWDDMDGDRPPGLSEPLRELVTHPADSGNRQFLQERYPDGKLFVTWFDDGSGHVMYPSGEPAILITVEPAGRRFVVLPNASCRDSASSSSNCVLAMFDPRGIGFVYSEKGNPRLLLDQREGWYHRDDGTIRRWHWSDLDDHVHHSPTLQPVIFAVSKHVAIRVIRQDYIMLSFWASQRSARFNVGVSAVPVEPVAVPPERYRLVCQPSDRLQLTELRDRVRRILGDMARITDEPVKYIMHHQKLLQRDLSVTLSRPVPGWVAAEPRQPQLPGGVSAALGRRCAAAVAVGTSARRAFLLQQMALAPRTDERPSSGRRAPPPAPPPLPVAEVA